MSISKKDKFRGCLIGQCLGDALGFPIEGLDQNICSKFIDDMVAAWLKGDQPPAEWTGQYTDDSQLARELLISIVEKGTFDPEDYSKRIADICMSNRIVGRGLATDKAAYKLINGVHWKEAGCTPPDAGNGTAMRAAPIGMLYHNMPNQMVEAAHLQGYITHQDPRCSAGSIAVAGAVALAITNEKIEIDFFTESLSNWMRPHSEIFSDWVSKLAELVLLPPEKAVEIIAKAGKPEDFIESWPGISPFVVGSVLWSLYSFLRHPDDYGKAISTAISIGGDVDTTGAMTGTISGAYLGLDALPKNLTKYLNDNGEWDYLELIGLADKCFDLVNV